MAWSHTETRSNCVQTSRALILMIYSLICHKWMMMMLCRKLMHSMNKLIEFIYVKKKSFSLISSECRAKAPAAPLGDSRSRRLGWLARWHTHRGRWTLRVCQSERLLSCQSGFEATEFQRQTCFVLDYGLFSEEVSVCRTSTARRPWSTQMKFGFFTAGSALRSGRLSYQVYLSGSVCIWCQSSRSSLSVGQPHACLCEEY